MEAQDPTSEMPGQGAWLGRSSAQRIGASTMRRRPSGEPPPLPRQLGVSGKLMIAVAGLAILAVLLVTVALSSAGPSIERFDSALLRSIAQIRSAVLTDLARALDALGAPMILILLRLATFVVLVVFRRWRHLFVFVGAVISVELITYGLSNYSARPRPFGVDYLAAFEGFSLPSRRIADVAVTLMAMTYTLVPAGRNRDRAKVATAVILLLFGLAQLYLGVSHLGDVVVGAIIGVTVPLVGFRWFCPNDVFPVTYGRGKTAHLDVGGRRGEAIRRAVADQLGFEVTEIKPIGLEGSGGSTPVRLTVAGAEGSPDTHLFAKVYAQNHVRADRWYKLGRTVMYGRLEDETPFQTVRRFVEYEDYTLGLMQRWGLPGPKPYGVVEITPEREYLIAMEFFDGAVEIGQAEVDDGIIDQGLEMIRRFWDLGLAHRDIKPSNLMVRDGKLLLVDVFFVQIRPSPWRQAVDLGNMMLTLALRTDAQRVYERALRYFTPDELAEAFAATRGVASPTQVRTEMKADGRDLLSQFRALAPERAPIAIQQWSVRRVALIAGLLLSTALLVGIVQGSWRAFL